MSIQLVTYANQTVTPTNDAIIYERAIDQNGIFYGCNVTVSGNEVHITGGYGIVCGREFTIQSEAIAVTLAPSGTLDGRLYVRLDLADADAPIQLLTATGNTLPPLVQDNDVNYTNGTYEMELATFTVGVSALSDVVETYEIIVGTKYELLSDDNWKIKKYKDGTAECWKTINAGSKAMTSASGSGYYAAESTYTFPTGLFNTTPTITLGAHKSGGLGGFAISSASSANFKGYWWDTASATRTVYLYVHAYGTWK